MACPPPIPDDDACGFELTDGFSRFDQKDDVFRRSWHDPAIRSEATLRFYRTYRETLRDWRRADGFRQEDYALRNAAWHVSDLFTEAREHEDRREGFSDAFSQNRDPAPERVAASSPAEAAQRVKRVARLFGAADVGIAAVDPRWLYAGKFSDMSGTARGNDIDPGLTHVIVTVQPMDRALIDTVPSALSGAATGLGYSHDALVVLALAQTIRNLGYRAVASMNDSALAIPMAIQAGLGEYGRHGLLITPGHGPRVRLGKVFTDMPLVCRSACNLHFAGLRTGRAQGARTGPYRGYGPVRATPQGRAGPMSTTRRSVARGRAAPGTGG